MIKPEGMRIKTRAQLQLKNETIAGNAPARDALITLAVALPWLNPFAPGPSPAVVPWLVALAATGSLIFLASMRSFSGELAGGASFAQRWAFHITRAWVLAGVLSSGIGLLQYFGATSTLEPWVNQTSFGEAFANLRQRNQFASLTNTSLAALIFWSATSVEVVGRRGWVVMLGAGVLAVGNAASLSRTGLVQLFLLCLLFWVWGAWRYPIVRRVLLTSVIAYAIATLALPWLAGLDLSLHGMAARLRAGDEACASRITLWSNVLHLIGQKPWTGWGWGELDYAHYMTLYDGPRFCEILDNAHNLPLHLAVELGVPLAVLVCGGFVWWVLQQQPRRETDPTRQLAWSVLTLILLHSMLEYPLWYGPFQMAFGMCVGLLWWTRRGQINLPEGENQVSNALPAPWIRVLIAIVLIASVSYAAWDYHRVSQIYLAPEARAAGYRTDTLNKIRGSWLFADQVRFAELLTTPLTSSNAAWTLRTASELLHYSPEPRIIEKIIESAVLLGKDEEAIAHLARYRAAFPKDHARWAQANARLP